MLTRRDAEQHLKELRSELRRWQNISRSNPWQYVHEYIGVLERRIEAYENIMPKTREVFYKLQEVKEVHPVEHWRM